jgi:hypothetical protein
VVGEREVSGAWGRRRPESRVLGSETLRDAALPRRDRPCRLAVLPRGLIGRLKRSDRGSKSESNPAAARALDGRLILGGGSWVSELS